MVFCNEKQEKKLTPTEYVTILILIDGFLQFTTRAKKLMEKYGHNPYFNRWFSAIQEGGDLLLKSTSHNPYFNRWFSAI